PILGLAIYLMTSNFSELGTEQLFPGAKESQASRYSQFMRRYYTRPEVAEELSARGLKQGELGTHSARKGAATFCASGSTDCPSITAIQLRAGWHLDG